ncbi:hypothetical protein HYH03_017971 [Edaphochlamys debaryana]|uniref:N-acetyltransferase domain-containing protein n=1 Tax=Edaphochlamys debaryana TaxID=47281 RepID=A0A835XGX8_9CHLO|nr:hypothetical protein HYH03_017971 [Edaphochlamys debaryana]|eukprot:KAG2483179.1 hypothetical protein HYH03_017971 [Edaphochlamys debaryana]
MYRLEAPTPDAAVIAELNKLEGQIFKKQDSWAGGELEQQLKKRNTIVVVARLVADDKLAGYVLCSSTGLNLHVAKVAVAPGCRRCGIARALMQDVLWRAATQRRSLSSSLHVALENAPALGLYRSLGYADDGLLYDYYSPGRHAAKMMADLEPYRSMQAPPPLPPAAYAAQPLGAAAADGDGGEEPERGGEGGHGEAEVDAYDWKQYGAKEGSAKSTCAKAVGAAAAAAADSRGGKAARAKR